MRRLLLFLLIPVLGMAQSITLNKNQTFQTISGWEYFDGIEGGQFSVTYPTFVSRFNVYSGNLYDQAAAAGFNRIKLDFNSYAEGCGSTTSTSTCPSDTLWNQYQAGSITFNQTYAGKTFFVISSNPSSSVLDLTGFNFDQVDWTITNQLIPMKQRVEAKGGKFTIIGCYIGTRIASPDLHNDPAFYARYVWAVFQHMQNKYGFVPDVWEMMNEPENSVVSTWQTNGVPMGQAIVQVATVLAAHGWHPKISAPSSSFIADVIPYFNQIISVSGASADMQELSYHYYNGHTTAQLQAIASAAAPYGMTTGMNESAGYNGTTATFLHDDLKYANNTFWMMGGMVAIGGPVNQNASYFQVNADNSVTLQPLMVQFQQFFKYIHAGAVRIAATSTDGTVDPVAFINTDGTYVVAMVATAADNNITIGNLPAGVYTITDSLGGAHANYTVTSAGTLTTSISGAGYLTVAGTVQLPTPVWTHPTQAAVLGQNQWSQLPFDPVSGNFLYYTDHNNGGAIYSDTLYACNSITSGTQTCSQIWASGSSGAVDTCKNDTPSVPGDRHPLGLSAYDSKRKRLWIGLGVNGTCGLVSPGNGFSVNTSGTIVTLSSASAPWVFPTDGSLNGAAFVYGPTNQTGTVASVQDATHLTATAPLTTQTGVQFQIYPGPNPNAAPRGDFYYMPLTATPASDVAVGLSPAAAGLTNGSVVGLGQFGSMVYDADDDVILLASSNQFGSLSFVAAYAPTDGTGIMTTKQSATGAGADSWKIVTTSGTGPTTGAFPALVYDTVYHVMVEFGAGGSTNTYEYAPSTKTWTQYTPATHPAANNTTGNWAHAMMAWLPVYGVTYLHDPNSPASDWWYSHGLWTKFGANGGPTVSDNMVYDTTNARLMSFGTQGLWMGQVGSASCSISPVTVGPWTVGQVISQTFTESNCSASSFSLSGAWPTGISGCSSGSGPTCSVTGTVGGSSGAFTPTISYSTAIDALNITVNAAPSVTTTSLPATTVGVVYSQTIVTSGGTAPVTCTANSGLSGSGLAVNSNCTVTGTASGAGSYTVTVTPHDANGIAGGGQAITLTVNASACVISSSTVGPWTVTQTVSQVFTESNCSASNFSLSGAWPTGVSGCNIGAGPTCTASGTISGSGGTFTPTISYSTATYPLSITVNAVESITTTALPSTMTGSVYSQTIATMGGTAPITCTANGGLTGSGLVVNSNCTITGTATNPATYTVTVTPHDANSITGNSQAISLVVNPASPPPSTTNALTVTNQGATVTNYPVQIGRAFKQGEIPSGQLPQAFINGISAPTQVDVKNTWPDSSVKFAVLSFLIPTFTASTAYPVTFGVGATVGNTPLTLAQMQAASFNFDAQIQMTKTSVLKTASALTMLSATSSIPTCEGINWTTSSGVNACYWTSGPIATTVIIANHAQSTTCGGKAASTYDFGWDTFCAFRPIFEATFWSGTNQVRVRYVGEVTNTVQLEDVAIDSMVLTLGATSPTTVYTRSTAMTMYAGSRWTKTFWLNGTPPNANLDHHVAYLATTSIFQNYDPTKTIPPSIISTAYNTNWLGVASQCSSGAPTGLDLYQAGEWNANGVCGDLRQPGGHDWVGPMPAWTARWLYTGDYRMQLESLGNADLLGAWSIHFREGDSARKIDRALTVPGLGRVMSVSGRTSFSYQSSANGFVGNNSNDGNALVPVGTASLDLSAGSVHSTFGSDPSHMPQIFAEYLLTGDHYYLEENLYWAGWATWWFQYAPLPYLNRGPTGAEGGINDRNGQDYQLRGVGEAYQSRVNAWLITPDAMPDKAYLNLLNQDAIADWEGMRNITTAAGGWGQANDTAEWNWGFGAAFTASPSTNRYWTAFVGNVYVGLPPANMNWWDIGNSGNCDSTNQTTPSASECYKNWMYSRVVIALGRAREVGYVSDALLKWVSVNYFAQVLDPTYNPFLTGVYTTAQLNETGPVYYSNWAAVRATFLTAVANETGFFPGNDANGSEFSGNGDIQSFAAASSYLVYLPNGTSVWNWVNPNIEAAIASSGCSTTQTCDTKWAILPRTITPAAPPPAPATLLIATKTLLL